MKEASKRPRLIESLKSELIAYKMRIPKIQEALNVIEIHQKNNKSPILTEELEEQHKFWLHQKKEFETKKASIEQQLNDFEKQQQPLGDSLRDFFNDFKERGLHLIMALLVFAILMFLFKFISKIICKNNPLHKNPKLLMWANLTDIVLQGIFIFIALCCSFFVLYSSGDWLLIAIGLVIVIGLIVALKNAFGHYWEQTKLILNIGGIRKGEKVIYNGVAYKVESIGVFSILKNPILTGGTLRLPIRDLIPMTSRAYDESEAWFPCKKDDFILFKNKDFRQVSRITPEVVELSFFGAPEFYSMQTFLKASVRNLSVEPFWAWDTIYLDHKYLPIAQSEIVVKLNAYVEIEAKKLFGDTLVSVWVEFNYIRNGSLGFLIGLLMKPEAASKYSSISRKLRQMGMQVALKNNWESPYSQLTISQSNEQFSTVGHFDTPSSDTLS